MLPASSLSINCKADNPNVRHLHTDGPLLLSAPDLSHLADAVNPDHGHPVPGHRHIHQTAVDVQLHVPRHLSVGHRLGRLLQLEVLEVNTLAIVGENVVGVQGTGRSSSLLNVALPGQLIPLQPSLDGDFGDGGPAGATLDGDARPFS